MSATEVFHLENSSVDSASARTDRTVSNVRDYYTTSTVDYAAWSDNLNMHFGYYRFGMNPFDREAMLEEMNNEVIRRCNVGAIESPRVLDMGCGVGATSRAFVRTMPDSRIDAVTIVAGQVAWGRELAARAGMASSIRFVLSDYTATGLAKETYDAAYALESACHSDGPDKRGVINEAARLLKSGASFVLVDGFRRHASPLRGFAAWVAQSFCRNWALPELSEKAAMRKALIDAGFTDIRFEDTSLRVAPSFAHVPWLASNFMLKELIEHRGRLPAWRWNHIKASYLSVVVGLMFWRFGYYIVTAKKR